MKKPGYISIQLLAIFAFETNNYLSVPLSPLLDLGYSQPHLIQIFLISNKENYSVLC